MCPSLKITGPIHWHGNLHEFGEVYFNTEMFNNILEVVLRAIHINRFN